MRGVFAIPLSMIAVLAAARSHAAEINLAALNCARYENVILAPPPAGAAVAAGTLDPIDTVMWLFGLSVARSGQHAMYGNSLPAFGFALDAECKNNPTTSLLDAVTNVSSKRDNPMDLTGLSCADFASRHAEARKSDAESSQTLTMWLFGYAVGLAGGHVLDTDALPKFESGLEDHCAKHPEDSLYAALSASNPGVPGSTGKTPQRNEPGFR